MTTKRKGHSSGYYKSPGGNVFHAHGKDMSDKTIEALGAMADAVNRNLGKQCPDCGKAWLRGLEWTQEQGWFCDCGWKGKFDDDVS